MKKVGDVFKIRGTEYTVVAVFEDDNEHFFVAKHRANWGWSYGVFAYGEASEEIYKRS